jgi:hypothetical protein
MKNSHQGAEHGPLPVFELCIKYVIDSTKGRGIFGGEDEISRRLLREKTIWALRAVA